MATATGYQGYGSPERAKVERERRLAELLQQGALDTGPKSLWEGVAQLGKAFIARDAMGRADKAEGEYGDSQRRAFDLLSSQMFPDSTAGTASVSQAPTPGDGAERKARLMAKANPEGTDPHAAMAAPQTVAAPAPSADPNAITKTDLPPLPQASPGVAAIAEALSPQGGPVSPYMQEYAQPGQPAPAAPPMAQPAPQMQPQAAPQAGMNPTARIAGALMAQPPMQKPPMQPQGQQQPQNIRAAVEQYFQMTGDMAGALELGKSMKPAAPELQALQGPDGGVSVFDKTTGTVKQITPGTPKPADPVKMETIQDANGLYYTFNPVTGETKPLDVRGRVPGSGDGGREPTLTPNQLLTAQLKIDDLDRELADTERGRKSSLSTVTSSIALLEDFLSPENEATFNEVYGNWVNPTGEGNDLFNPRVTPGSARANGMAILEQVGGRAFLDSIQAMRGTGALSDREGAKVGAAATRLMQVTQDDAAAREAGQEFLGTLQSYKAALEQDLQASRAAEASRRQQVAAMMGVPVPAPMPNAQTAFAPAAAPAAQAPDINSQKPPPGLSLEMQRAWQMGTPRVRQEILTRMSGGQQAAPPPAAADLGDDELRAMLGL